MAVTPDQKIEQARKLLVEARAELTGLLKDDKTRRRSIFNQSLWRAQRMLGLVPEYYSQSGQDRFIDTRVAAGKRGGVFVDVGGYDGITGSNTLFFEVFRNWKGLLIEPMPEMLARARLVRHCPCIGAAVAGEAGTGQFMSVVKGYTQMSGFIENYDEKMLAQVRSHPDHEEKITEMDKRPLAEILSEYRLEQIDYVSLDVEGAEIEIIESFPFSEFDITALSVENNTRNPDIPRLMKEKGYEVAEFTGVDDIFLKAR